MDLQQQSFSTINMAEPFVDSLIATYPKFSDWYNRKPSSGAMAYVSHSYDGREVTSIVDSIV